MAREEIKEKKERLDSLQEDIIKLLHNRNITVDEAIEYANTFKAILSQQNHLRLLEKRGESYRPDLSFNEGDIVFINFNRQSPRDFFGGHWSIILKKYSDARYLVVPLTSSTSNRYQMKIEYEIEEKVEKNNYRLKNAVVVTKAEGMLVADWVVPTDVMTIDFKRPILKLITPLDEIKRYLIGQMFY